MVKRVKHEEPVGTLEFEGRNEENPTFIGWLADHKARNGGKIRISKGARGVRVMFSKQSDLDFWRQQSEPGKTGQRRG